MNCSTSANAGCWHHVETGTCDCSLSLFYNAADMSIHMNARSVHNNHAGEHDHAGSGSALPSRARCALALGSRLLRVNRSLRGTLGLLCFLHSLLDLSANRIRGSQMSHANRTRRRHVPAGVKPSSGTNAIVSRCSGAERKPVRTAAQPHATPSEPPASLPASSGSPVEECITTSLSNLAKPMSRCSACLVSRRCECRLCHLDRCTSDGSRLHAACVAALLARHLSLLILQCRKGLLSAALPSDCCNHDVACAKGHLLVRLAELHGPCNLCRTLAIMKQGLGLLVQEQESLRDRRERSAAQILRLAL